MGAALIWLYFSKSVNQGQFALFNEFLFVLFFIARVKMHPDLQQKPSDTSWSKFMLTELHDPIVDKIAAIQIHQNTVNLSTNVRLGFIYKYKMYIWLAR